MTPEVNEIWKHHSGRLYRITGLANLYAGPCSSLGFPVTVVYTDLENNRLWARPLDVFVKKFERYSVFDSYEYLGDFSATPPTHSRAMSCHKCRVSWTGCWDNFQCPKCGEGELPTSELLDATP